MNNTPKMTRKYKYAKLRYEIELENISYTHNETRKKYRNIQLSLTLSIVSIFLSLGLMVGTTFAWFTSTVSNSGNVIKAGYIDVELFAKQGEEIINLTNSNSPAFSDLELSPESNKIETEFTVKNIGTLPLKCYMCFKDIDDLTDEAGLSSKILVSAKAKVDGGIYTDPIPMRTLVDESHYIFSIDRLEANETKQIIVKLSLDNEAPQDKTIKFDICLHATQINQ